MKTLTFARRISGTTEPTRSPQPRFVAMHTIEIRHMHRGDKDDGGLVTPGMLADQLQFEPADLGHVHIHQHDRDIFLQQISQRLLRGSCLDEVLAQLPEHRLIGQQLTRLIVHHQDVQLLHGFATFHLAVQPHAKCRDQLLGVDRLRQIIRRTGLKALFSISHHCLRRKRDDRKAPVSGIAADLAHRFVPVHLRHHDIHQHDSRFRLRFERLDRFATRIRRQHLHAAAFKHAGEREDVADVIVDDQHLLANQVLVGPVQSLERVALGLGQVGHHTVQEQRGFVEQTVRRFHALDDDAARQHAQARVLIRRKLFPGEHDDREVAQFRFVANCLQHVEPGHVRQPQIENHAVIGLLAQRHQRRGSRIGDGDVDIVVFEQCRDAFLGCPVVVDDSRRLRRLR